MNGLIGEEEGKIRAALYCWGGMSGSAQESVRSSNS